MYNKMLLFFIDELVPLFIYIANFIQCLFNLNLPINMLYIWSKIYMKIAKCNIYLIDNSRNLYSCPTKRCLFLANRRDMYDLVIDTYLTDGSAMFVSPVMLMCAFPWQYICNFLAKHMLPVNDILPVNDRLPVNDNIYTALSNTAYRHLIIYPEEVRPQDSSLKPIHTDAIQLAWTYHMCIQILITKRNAGLDTFFSLQGVNFYCYRSEVINPKYFSSFEEFNTYVCLLWESHI